MTRRKLMRLAELAVSGSEKELAAALRRAVRHEGPQWRYFGRRTAAWLESDGELPPPFRLFVRGNGKLPFFAWSTLPLVTCPGSGSCRDWCYSLKAWRYPAAFLRQLQNTVLERTAHGRERIRAAWAKLPHGTTVRLYVDGDFPSLDVLAHWMRTVDEQPDLAVYGYSKSWHLLVAWGARNAFPGNYAINLSSGSRFDGDERMRRRVEALSCVRGSFVALDGLATRADYRPDRAAAQRRHLQELRERGRAMLGTSRVFACPGRCGSCMPQGHACGSMALRGIPVVIANHS